MPTTASLLIRTVSLALVVTLLGGGAVSAAGATGLDAGDVEMAIEVDADGHGPFSADDSPGGDTGRANGIVRTNDLVTYRVSLASSTTVAGVSFVVTAPADTRWNELPSACRSGSAIAGSTLTCVVGAIGHEVTAVPVTLLVVGTAPNAARVSVTGHPEGSGGPLSDPVESPVTLVSAAPRFDLAKDAKPSIISSGVVGPTGETGMTLTYPISIAAVPLVAGQGRLGSEMLAGPLDFDDDPSGIVDDPSSLPRLLTNGAGGGCRLNDRSQFAELPGGTGGGRANVRHSGTIRCEQVTEGGPIAVHIEGTDTSLETVPDQSVDGGVLAGGSQYVVQMTITVWFPHPVVVGSTWEAVNRFSALRADSLSGQPNYAGGEPLANNVSTRTVSQFVTGGFYKIYGRLGSPGGTGKSGDPFVTAGTHFRSHANITNKGFGAYRHAIACDTFDNSEQMLEKGPSGAYAVAAPTEPGATVEYAAYDWTTPEAARDRTCDDADGPWYADPADVPGGPSAVSSVRATFDTVPGGTQAALFTYLRILPGEKGARIRNFGAAHYGDTVGEAWVTDTTSADLAAGGQSDFLLRVDALARVTKRIVDDGATAEQPGDTLESTTAGSDVTYLLSPSLTSLAVVDKPETVTLVDDLPAGATYAPGSGSIAPTTIETVGDHERITWELPDVDVNSTIPGLTYDAHFDGLLPSRGVTNSVVVTAPGDDSTASLRTASRGLQVVAGAGLGTEESTERPVVLSGDDLTWTLDYRNNQATSLDGSDLVTELPYDGDAAGSQFNGAARLGSAVVGQPDERVVYTSTAHGAISLDPSHPSNQPGGATTWCSEADFGDDGCPAALSDVTGLRLIRSAAVAPGATVSHDLVLVSDGADDSAVYVNRFGIRTPSIPLFVGSPSAEIRVVSGSIGDRVWSDTNRDGLQGAGEEGVAGVTVRLQPVGGSAAASQTTTTDNDGRYSFESLRPGRYRVTFTAPTGSQWTRTSVGDDRDIDSDVDAHGAAAVALAEVTEAGQFTDVDDDPSIDAGLIGLGGGGAGGGSGGDSGDAGGSDGAGGSGERPRAAGATAAAGLLAYTGSHGLGLLLACAALAIVTGAGSVILARRRREEGARP